MKCTTGKISYATEELAEEALIQHRIRNDHREGSGPINIYECEDCGEWHFTSKGRIAEFLRAPEIANRIRRERQSLEWERRLR